MVVRCEKCSTRFRLDESRIPPTGARVRCSRCKHAFFLAPGAGASETPIGPPPTTEDLDEPLAAASCSEPPPEPETLDDDDESQWEFSEELPHAEDAAEARESFGASEGPPAAERGSPIEAADSAAGLGSPESWDLVGNAEDSESAPGEPLELEDRSIRDRKSPEAACSSPPVVTPRALAVPSAAGLAEPDPAPARRVRRFHALAPVGWLLVAVLLAVALGEIFFPRRVPAVAHVLRAGRLDAHDLRGRFVENASAGPLFVVSAELRNDSSSFQVPSAALRVVLLASDGSRLPVASAPVAPALEESWLREATPEAIQEQLERGARDLAAASLAPAARVRVDAVLPRVPPEAVRFALEEVPVSELGSDTAATEPASLPSLPSSPE